MKAYDKMMSDNVYPKAEVKSCFDRALKEVKKAEDGKKLISLCVKYAERLWSEPAVLPVASKKDQELVEEYEDYLDELEE